MIKETGGPALPIPGTDYNDLYLGMSIRDFFAASALQGWLSSYSEDEAHPASNGNENLVAENAYKMADAMLKARGD